MHTSAAVWYISFLSLFFCAQVHLTVMIACLRRGFQLAVFNICAQAADLVSTLFPIWALGKHFLAIRCRRMSILAYICSSLDSRLLGSFSSIWGLSRSLLKYDTFSLSKRQFRSSRPRRPFSWFRGSHFSLRLQSEPPGFNLSLEALNLSLEASISASRLQSEPPGFNLSLQAQC